MCTHAKSLREMCTDTLHTDTQGHMKLKALPAGTAWIWDVEK